VVRLEELEAAQLSPVSKQLPPLAPSSSSTPADGTALGSSTLVTRDAGVAGTRVPHTLAPAGGPSHAHIPPGPAPALPAGAQTLEQIEAGLQNMTLPSAPAAVNATSANATAAAASSTNGDLSAFNKLLHLVNKSQPNIDQVCDRFGYLM